MMTRANSLFVYDTCLIFVANILQEKGTTLNLNPINGGFDRTAAHKLGRKQTCIIRKLYSIILRNSTTL